MRTNYFLFFSLTLFFGACSNPDEMADDNITDNGVLQVSFNSKAGLADFSLGETYTNANQEEFSLTRFQYYVSNVRLISNDGQDYELPLGPTSGYFLINGAEKQTILMEGIPEGNYHAIRFLIGVDSLRNTMEPSQRMGDLDIGNPNAGGSMYWSWNSGYIFMRFEGHSPAVPDSVNADNKFTIHVGGFGGYQSPTPNNNKWVELPLNGERGLRISANPTHVRLQCNVLNILDGDTNHSLAQFNSEHSPMRTQSIAQNYAKMFTQLIVENE